MTGQVAVFLAGLALKSTIILGGAFALAGALRRFSSEERHVLWAAALIALLALPLLALFGPRVDVPMPGRAALVTSTTDAAGTVPGAAHARTAPVDRVPAGSERRSHSASNADSNSAGTPDAGSTGVLTMMREAPWRSSAAMLATTLYLGIALLLLARYAVAVAGTAVSLRRLEPATDASVLALTGEIRDVLGVRRRVRLKLSPSDSTPWAWGVFRPVVVLPKGFSRLPAESQRDALVHELSHVVRLDFASTLLGCVCAALYWFQPLAWMALRRMARESERACDDRVLLAGSCGTSYASQLLDLARTIHGSRKQPVFATAMAGTSAIAQRITSILDLARRRRTVNKSKVCSALFLAVLLTVPLAALQSQEAPPLGDPDDAGFRALVQKGPANSDELGLLARTYVAEGRQAEAVEILADYLARDRAGTAGEIADVHCEFCRTVLEKEDRAGDLVAAVLAAFDEVEQRARTAGDGDLLIRLAAVAGTSDDAATTGRGTFYLVEGFRLGNLEDASKLEAIGFLNDLGWYPQAKALAERLYNDEASSLYQSSELETWIWRLDYRVNQREGITQRLMTPNATFAYSDDVVPVYREAPDYPTAALRQNREADVLLEFTITDQGRTADISVVRSTDSLFNDSAVASLAEWRYLPQVVDGTAVPESGVQTLIRFVLEE